jgi:cyclopropane fatty-acyl-phospholipid synthase-like methyltransferase
MFETFTLESYTDIFNQRGQLYHQAMLDYPDARRAEFTHALDLLDLQPGQVLCDVPSGGCYISRFIDLPVKLISVETSEEFIRHAAPTEDNVTLICEDVTQIPLTTATVDRIVSLAGLHHVAHQADFYREAYRLLKPQGILAVADVRAGSGVDGFLNGFVNQYNSMGHRGEFLGPHTVDELQTAGFEVVDARPRQYTWTFQSPAAMVRCCQLLFGIDRADADTTLAGIRRHLGYTMVGDRCCMNWELYFFKAIKPGAVAKSPAHCRHQSAPGLPWF